MSVRSNLVPERQDTLCILDNLTAAELALAIQPVHEGNGALCNLESHGLGPDHHLHLESVALALRALDDLLKHILLVQPEAARQVRDSGVEHNRSEKIGALRNEFALKVPSVHASVTSIPGTGNDIIVALLLLLDELGDGVRMMRKVGIHDDDKVAGSELHAVNICSSESELSGTRVKLDLVGAEGLDELLRNVLGAIGGSVIDNYKFPGKTAIRIVSCESIPCQRETIRVRKCLVEQIGDDWEVLALIVGGQDNGVLVRHFGVGLIVIWA